MIRRLTLLAVMTVAVHMAIVWSSLHQQHPTHHIHKEVRQMMELQGPGSSRSTSLRGSRFGGILAGIADSIGIDDASSSAGDAAVGSSAGGGGGAQPVHHSKREELLAQTLHEVDHIKHVLEELQHEADDLAVGTPAAAAGGAGAAATQAAAAGKSPGKASGATPAALPGILGSASTRASTQEQQLNASTRQQQLPLPKAKASGQGAQSKPPAPIDYKALVAELTAKAALAHNKDRERFESELNQLPSDADKDVNAPLRSGLSGCSLLTASLVAKHARDKTVMLSIVDWNMFGVFGPTWLRHVRKAGIDNVLVAASDMPTAQELVKQKVPCFEFWTLPGGCRWRGCSEEGARPWWTLHVCMRASGQAGA
jgi:hypothetical protein